MTTEIVDLHTGAQLTKAKKEAAVAYGNVLRPIYTKDQPSLSHSQSPRLYNNNNNKNKKNK